MTTDCRGETNPTLGALKESRARTEYLFRRTPTGPTRSQAHRQTCGQGKTQADQGWSPRNCLPI